jgi:hypothetical protein
MAIESVRQHLNRLADNTDRQELQAVLGSLVDALQAICAKLDADAGVTDTNYAATLATYITD